MKQYELLIDRLEEMACDDKVRVCDKRTLMQAADAMKGLQNISDKQAGLNDKLLTDLLLMEAQLRKVEEVRDKAVADLLLNGIPDCAICAHNATHPACECECLDCKKEECFCHDCRDGSKFLWRGMVEQD